MYMIAWYLPVFVTFVSVMHMIACEGGGVGGVRLGGVTKSSKESRAHGFYACSIM